ncbi:MAG TPA: hypothetical protein VJ953_08765 [Saprospiraceae bacterium]|nr:hypothetical protein [Saprospiraceae bacterium]
MKPNNQLFSRLLLLALIGSCFQLQAQQHVIKKSFEAASEINIRHRRGPLNVAPSEDGKVHFEAEISFEAKDKAEGEKLIKAFSVQAGKVGDRIDINSNLGIKSFNTIGRRSTIIMGNGTKITGISNLKVYLTVKVPEVRQLKVDNRYDEINVFVDVKEKLIVNAYSSEIRISNISGDLAMSAKYSSGSVRTFKNGNIELYESKINFEKGQDIIFNAKYSTVEVKSAESFKAESYENKFKLGNISGLFEIDDKYSTFEMSDFEDAQLVLYETDIRGNNGQDIRLQSKYSDLEWNSVGKVYFNSSYEDELRLERAKSLQSVESKYSKYKISELENSLEIDSYEDDIWIAKVISGMASISIQGKYTKLTCPISADTPFRIDMKARYTSFDLEEDDLDIIKYIDKGDTKEISGSRNQAGEQSLKIHIDCYDCKVQLKG